MITEKMLKIEKLIKSSDLNDKELIYLYNFVYNNISNKGFETLKFNKEVL